MPASSRSVTMNLKRDPYFTFLALFILAGVVVALLNPMPAAAKPDQTPALATATPVRLPAHS